MVIRHLREERRKEGRSCQRDGEKGKDERKRWMCAQEKEKGKRVHTGVIGVQGQGHVIVLLCIAG